jgi:hypothetical protein
VALTRLYADMIEKQAHVFIWIILARDLSAVDLADQEGICVAPHQRRWNKAHPYNDRSYLDIAQRFLNRVREERDFTVIKSEVQTNEDFPSTYHFWFCDFTETRADQEPRAPGA